MVEGEDGGPDVEAGLPAVGAAHTLELNAREGRNGLPQLPLLLRVPLGATERALGQVRPPKEDQHRQLEQHKCQRVRARSLGHWDFGAGPEAPPRRQWGRGADLVSEKWGTRARLRMCVSVYFCVSVC